MLRSLRVPFIVWVTIACSVDQPLPPPNNPPTCAETSANRNVCRTTLCVSDDDCGEQICQTTIGGGACADDCRTHGADGDNYCSGLVEGYVCQGELGVCGPRCTDSIGGVSGDPVCAAMGKDLVCLDGGQCHYTPPAPTAFLRVFNATSDRTIELLAGGTSVLTGLAPGQLSAELTVAAGGSAYAAQDGGGTLATLAKTLQPAKRYFLIVHPLLASGHQLLFVDAEGPATPQPDNPWLFYRQVVPGLTAQDVRVNSAAVFSNIGFRVETDPVQIPLVSTGDTFAISPTPAQPATMTGVAALAVDRSYLVLTWVGDGVLPETAILGRNEGVVARFSPVGMRLANAILESSTAVSVGLDGAVFLQAGQRLSTAPTDGYALVAPGSHRVVVLQGATTLLDTTQMFVGGRKYTALVGGSTANLSAPLKAKLLDDSAAVAPAGDKIAARAVHLAAAGTQASLALDVSAGEVIATAVPYGEVLPFPPFAEITLAPTLTFTATLATQPAVTGKYTPLGARAATAVIVGAATKSTPDIWVLDDRGGHVIAAP